MDVCIWHVFTAFICTAHPETTGKTQLSDGQQDTDTTHRFLERSLLSELLEHENMNMKAQKTCWQLWEEEEELEEEKEEEFLTLLYLCEQHEKVEKQVSKM